MSNTNKKGNELSTKEVKRIQSTLFLLEDNKNKLYLISKLKEVNNFINTLVLDCNQKLNIM